MLHGDEGGMTTVPSDPIVPETIRRLPGFEYHVGKAVTLEPLSIWQVDDLREAGQAADVSWTYLKYGPFRTKDDMAAHVTRISSLEQLPFSPSFRHPAAKPKDGRRAAILRPATPPSRSGASGYPPPVATHPRRHGSHFPDDAARLRTRLLPGRVALQCAERSVYARRAPVRLHL